MVHLPGAATTPAPIEPTTHEWMLMAVDLLNLKPQRAREDLAASLSGWLRAAYRTGYWHAKVAEVDPASPGPAGVREVAR